MLKHVDKPKNEDDLRIVFGQLSKQLLGYLLAQKNPIGSAQVCHLVKDGHMYRNFLFLIGVHLNFDWMNDFAQYKLLESSNLNNVFRDTLANNPGREWITTEITTHNRLFFDRLLGRKTLPNVVAPRADQLQNPE